MQILGNITEKDLLPVIATLQERIFSLLSYFVTYLNE